MSLSTTQPARVARQRQNPRNDDQLVQTPRREPPARRAATVPADESPNDRFHRLAVARVNKVLKDMKAVARLSGTRYKWTDVQAGIVVSAIQSEADRIRMAFSRQEYTEPFDF